MSFEWSSQPLSIQSIANQYTLPVVIRSAPGFRGSNFPIILHSISRVTFAFGRALRGSQSTPNGSTSYRPIDSEILAVPLNFPGYFECLSSRHSGQHAGVVPEKSIPQIVERMQIDHRPQAFYIASPMRVYTIETNAQGVSNRVWHQIEAHQIILFEKIITVQYTPTQRDGLTEDDYTYQWFCFGKQIMSRTEHAVKCILSQQHTCFIPCSSTDEVKLIPVGQSGSTNVHKLQTIQNLIEQFPMPVNIKLAQLPGSYAYKDFNGNLQILGSRSEQFAICASLSSSHIAVIPTNIPLKFVVAPLPSSQYRTILSSCRIFSQSFDMQIRRIIVSSYHDTSNRRNRSRYPKIQAEIDNQFKRFKRSYSVDQTSTIYDDQTSSITTDEGYRSSSSIATKRNYYKAQRAFTGDVGDNSQQHKIRRRTLSTDEEIKHNPGIHRLRTKKGSLSPSPPPLPEKPANFPYPTNDSGSNLIEHLDASNADGAILIDESNELFLALPSDSRFT